MGRMVSRYDDGALTLRHLAREYRFQWHPSPRAEERDGRGRWPEAWPDIRLFSPGSGDPEAVAAFRQTIPADLVAAVERFPSHQWSPLVLMGTEPYAHDLALTCPVLAFCVANNHCFRGGMADIAASLARRHCRQPRKDIAGWLGFPPADSTAKVLARICPEAATPAALLALQVAMREQPELRKLLLHLPSINAGVMFFASRWRLGGLPTFSLLSEIATAPEELENALTGSLLIDALRLMNEIDSTRHAPAFESTDQVRRFHESIVREHHELVRRREADRAAAVRRQQELACAEARRCEPARDNAKLPSPPIPGTETITPLLTLKDLEQESAEQANCAASMAQAVRDGGSYIYRVVYPSRATVELWKGRDLRWRLAQIKGPRNSKVPPQTRRAVLRWLDRAQQ